MPKINGMIKNPLFIFFLSIALMITQFTFVPKQALGAANPAVVSGSTYKIVNVNSNKLLDVAGSGTTDGTNVQQWAEDATRAQKWVISLTTDGFYRIKSSISNKVLDISGMGTTNGTNVHLWEDNGSEGQKWSINTNSDGTFTIVNKYANKPLDVSWSGVTNGTNVQIAESNGTGAQKWKLTLEGGLQSKVLGGYWTYWPQSPIRIRDIDPNYNLIYLFSATPVGGAPGTTGAVTWNTPGNGRGAATNLVADINYARTVQGRKIILSVGGANAGITFENRQRSQNFINSIVSIYNQLGGFDGIDWNNYEGSVSANTDEMIWISLELKKRYPGFIITTPPAPWRAADLTLCTAMVQAGALDYAAPQYYDGPGLNDPAFVVSNLDKWVTALGAEHVAVGFGVSNQANYMTVNQVVTAWNQIKAKYPKIRGAFDWEIHMDESRGWEFSKTLKPLLSN
ncbi:RICIN domain-containing protein [Paenibacillus whitsoniae]|uniref:GH18 domain-containing protein n=1 Tax=Paenibacillus whitsoniae TaxID=2496558 RepID=A0A430JII4_9BACL|nr:RICIN domain-containing protein [Paenibacillus whitsoniae]RTE10839.1 hypothetical protein EJQ19_06140 [Paenibacillus whitsoniae]